MARKLFICMVLLASLTLATGCGGGKSKRKAKAPDPTPAVDPIEDGDGGGDGGGGVEGDGAEDGDGTGSGDGAGDGTGTEGDEGNGGGGGGDDPFELPDGSINPTDPLFPPGDNTDGGDLGPAPGGPGPIPNNVAMPEPATLLTVIVGGSLLGLRRRHRQA